ncbi:HAD hydrolase-like protein [Mycolicibacterium brisbanense]|uniref:Putative phosphoglycolate phosphatase, bacterial n=1 Tax=Mycolicibacterium brisbanense TaxID=146020 RepID=A0A100W0Q8_9MYCO|nr:HAD hydrolase-like protein [Mycolicibacterium brisbanense]MCV7156083.1 HAD hydrolase-like protein [Mycolicibacterium brisbanense]GAS89521.1 putative phosphoglycolate phosphatase, bacterial [Mycolicibacterium brisbanense]
MSFPETKWTCVLFDLDGTIANSAKNITEAFAATLSELGLPVPPPHELRTWVGPPPAESFRVRFGFDDAAAEHARQLYRKHYQRIGNADIRPFDEVLPALEALAQQGIPMAVATSKPEHTAIEVLGRLGLSRYFVTVSGASRDETISDKASIVGEALRRLSADGVDTSNPVMVGDRLHDVVGAAEHGLPTVLVEWGYGQPGEHARALVTVGSADALTDTLLGR